LPPGITPRYPVAPEKRLLRYRTFFCQRGQIDVDRNGFNVTPEGLKRGLLWGVGNLSETFEKLNMASFLA
jgi:hypothetical protein